MSKSDKLSPTGQVSHGIFAFLKTGKISPSVKGFRRIQSYLREVEADLIAEQGGPEALTVGREILIKSTCQALGVLLLTTAYTQRYSILRPDAAKKGILELQPCLGKQYIAFLNSIRRNLALLGIDRAKARPEEALVEIMAQYDKKNGG